METFGWNPEKNAWLKKHRGISFEDVVGALENKQLLNRIPHPNRKRYPNQQIFIIKAKGYIYCVPFVEDKKRVFLKTIFASRKYQKLYEKKTI